jgi:hypothetical protein
MFLQFCEKTEVNRVSAITNAEHKKKKKTTLFAESRNAERLWAQHFGVSGFGISRFQMPNTNTQQLPNCENVNGMWDQHFGVSGFGISGFTNT